MTNTIEVPIELIKAGDLDAIRELLPKPNLFGRWATHPKLGRGIIISAHPDLANNVWFARKIEEGNDGADWECVVFEDFTLDPVELTTVEDFENAPVGTIVAKPQGEACQKVFDHQWESLSDLFTDKEMEIKGPWKILRWGWGE
jgi:hypothetical protein